MSLDPIHVNILIFVLGVSLFAYVCVRHHLTKCYQKKRKKFLIKEMRHALDTREQVYGSEIINHCRIILRNIELHCDMTSLFKTSYTYGEFEIGVNWYPVNGQFEFINKSFEPIARIYYPGN